MMRLLQCRICQSTNLNKLIDLGLMPLVNRLEDGPEQVKGEDFLFPLDLYYCPQCKSAQIGQTVDPELLFRHYPYCSSTADYTRAYGDYLVKNLKSKVESSPQSFIVEIGSNDGALLESFRREGFVNTLGVEPAVNIAQIAVQKGLQTLNRFFNETAAAEIVHQYGRADLIVACNVMAHVPDIHNFIKGMKILLAREGVIAVEAGYLPDMISTCSFDTIYHEHVFYLSLHTMMSLLEMYGLEVFEVEHNSNQGGSALYYVTHRNQKQRSSSISHLLAKEKEFFADHMVIRNFPERVEQTKADLLSMLKQLRSQGFRIAAYGAAAKGTILLNYCGIDANLVDYVVDKNPHKHNKYLPGVHIPIYGVERVIQDQPGYLLLLAWNYKDEVLGQQAEYREQGGKFIVPYPSISII